MAVGGDNNCCQVLGDLVLDREVMVEVTITEHEPTTTNNLALVEGGKQKQVCVNPMLNLLLPDGVKFLFDVNCQKQLKYK